MDEHKIRQLIIQRERMRQAQELAHRALGMLREARRLAEPCFPGAAPADLMASTNIAEDVRVLYELRGNKISDDLDKLGITLV